MTELLSGVPTMLARLFAALGGWYWALATYNQPRPAVRARIRVGAIFVAVNFIVFFISVKGA